MIQTIKPFRNTAPAFLQSWLWPSQKASSIETLSLQANPGAGLFQSWLRPRIHQAPLESARIAEPPTS